MRRLTLLLGLLILIACGGAEVDSFVDEDADVSESRGQEEAARPTPLPPREKDDLAQLAVVESITSTQPVTTTLSISTTMRSAASAADPPARPDNFNCSFAPHESADDGE